jgi:hypothetical protein
MKGKIIRTQWCDRIEIQLAMHTPLVALVWLHFPTLKFHGVQCMRMYAAYLDGCFFIASSHKIGSVPSSSQLNVPFLLLRESGKLAIFTFATSECCRGNQVLKLSDPTQFVNQDSKHSYFFLYCSFLLVVRVEELVHLDPPNLE